MRTSVLILVLVEHTLRGNYVLFKTLLDSVLILVLVEHTLRVQKTGAKNLDVYVLILVLVEHTLRANGEVEIVLADTCLNPCFSGTYSQRL